MPRRHRGTAGLPLLDGACSLQPARCVVGVPEGHRHHIGTYWCTAVVDRTPAGLFSVRVGVPYTQVKWMRGRETGERSTSMCSDPACCSVPPADLAIRWDGLAWPSARGAFTLAGRQAAWSVSWRRRHRSAEVLGTTRRSLRHPGGTPASVVIAFGGDRCRVLRLARRPERLRPTR
jgi:hypothetical protein